MAADLFKLGYLLLYLKIENFKIENIKIKNLIMENINVSVLFSIGIASYKNIAL